MLIVLVMLRVVILPCPRLLEPIRIGHLDVGHRRPVEPSKMVSLEFFVGSECLQVDPDLQLQISGDESFARPWAFAVVVWRYRLRAPLLTRGPYASFELFSALVHRYTQRVSILKPPTCATVNLVLSSCYGGCSTYLFEASGLGPELLIL